jgi:ribosomal protein S18 acetylase RimI-like enzyme
MPSNLERMIQLADEVFDVKHDPSQIAVNEEVLERLRALHPYALRELSNEEGPIAWILVIPTTTGVMNDFLAGSASEKDLLDRTFPDSKFSSIYLCSALVLPEHQRKGIALRLTVDAVDHIRKDHPITSLYSWPFTEEGKRLAGKVAEVCMLPLLIRDHKQHLP